jgi:mono/diheme cytochrome c family protein
VRRGATLAMIVAAVGMLGAAGVVWLNRDDVDGAPAPAAPTADLVARGEYLVRAGSCFGCHTEPGGAAYAGGRAI